MKKSFLFVFIFAVLALLLASCVPAANIAGSTMTSDYVAPALATTEIGGSLGGGIGWAIGALVVAFIVFGVISFYTEIAKKVITGAVAGVILFVLIFGGAAAANAYVVVEQGHVGVVVQQGEYVQTINSGQHWIMPWLQKVVIFSTREFTFTTVSDPVNQGSEQYRTYTMDVTTSDGVQGVVKFQAQVSMNSAKAKELYETYGTLENAVVQLLKTPSLSLVRDALRGKTALEVVTSIDEYDVIVEEQLRPIMEAGGLNLIRFSFRKPDLGAWEAERNSSIVAEQTAIKEENLAEVAKAQAQASVYQAEAQADIARANAQGQADAAVITATGQAEVAIINADAQAEALLTQKQAEAEANDMISKTITAQLIEYLKWTGWDGKLPTYMGGNGTPLFQLP